MTTITTARRKRRVFLWIFLAVQALFVLWIITGTTATTAPCHGLSASDCRAAADTGKGIGVAFIVAFWCVTTVILGGGYAVYRLARRPR